VTHDERGQTGAHHLAVRAALVLAVLTTHAGVGASTRALRRPDYVLANPAVRGGHLSGLCWALTAAHAPNGTR
jgi:hypothetical protein